MAGYHDEETPVFDSGPTAVYVGQFHLNSDVDSAANAQHHTLGLKTTQASPGHHSHDGINSVKLLDGFSINAGTVENDIVACLVRLGAEDLR